MPSSPKYPEKKTSERAKAKEGFWLAVVGEPSGSRDLWERVAYWRNRLRSCEDYPVLDGLESSWQSLNRSYGNILGRADVERVSSNPFSAFFYYVDLGFYPPPEILLAMQDAFEVYSAARGAISLEEAFFGPPRRKAGSYALRSATRFDRLRWGFRIDSLMRKGHTKTQAAEIVSEEEGGQVEPETIARRAYFPKTRTNTKRRK